MNLFDWYTFLLRKFLTGWQKRGQGAIGDHEVDYNIKISKVEFCDIPLAEFVRHDDIVAEKKLPFAERFVHKV